MCVKCPDAKKVDEPSVRNFEKKNQSGPTWPQIYRTLKNNFKMR